MNPEYLVDSAYVIDVLQGSESAARLLNDLSQAGLALSVISYAEVYEGVHYSRTRADDLRRLLALLGSFEVRPVTHAVAERFAILRGSLSRNLRQQIGDMDLMIAATALAEDLTLVTRNMRDFQHVPGLRLYQT